jgi:hypothetical protein
LIWLARTLTSSFRVFDRADSSAIADAAHEPLQELRHQLGIEQVEPGLYRFSSSVLACLRLYTGG